ncbi:MAG: hypothetical protein NMNS01_30650 [Nitrosomonas sp.]|nr:MAG: hypothetical protein NMNS01_30650 [Nitrosomonas sp.]
MAHRKEHIIVFEHRNFRGQHRHIFGEESNLNHSEDNTLNDKISSFIVLSGDWKLYRHANFSTAYDRTFAPGEYSWVVDFGVENDNVSSLKAV